MDLRIIGTGIAVAFAIIALSAVTLYLTFRIKETFREDKGTKVQIAKIGFIIGVLFLAGGTFFFFAEAIQPSKNTTTTIYSNNTNYTPGPASTTIPETGGIYELRSPVRINEDPIINHTQSPVPTPSTARWGDYYSPATPSSPTIEHTIIPAPVISINTQTNLSNGTNTTPMPTATPHNNESTTTPTPTVSPTVTLTPTPTQNSTSTSIPTPSPTTPTPTLSPIPTSTPEPTPGHTPATTPTPAPTITVTATPTTTLTSKA